MKFLERFYVSLVKISCLCFNLTQDLLNIKFSSQFSCNNQQILDSPNCNFWLTYSIKMSCWYSHWICIFNRKMFFGSLVFHFHQPSSITIFDCLSSVLKGLRKSKFTWLKCFLTSWFDCSNSCPFHTTKVGSSYLSVFRLHFRYKFYSIPPFKKFLSNNWTFFKCWNLVTRSHSILRIGHVQEVFCSCQRALYLVSVRSPRLGHPVHEQKCKNKHENAFRRKVLRIKYIFPSRNFCLAMTNTIIPSKFSFELDTRHKFVQRVRRGTAFGLSRTIHGRH